MHSLPELKRLNALHMDEVQYPRLHSIEPRLHPLVAASISSIEAQRPLSAVQADELLAGVIFGEGTHD